MFFIVDGYGSLVHEFSYTGDEVVVNFLQKVLHCEELLINTTKFKKYMIFTKENRNDFEKANVCYICNNNRGINRKKKKHLVNLTKKSEAMITLQGSIWEQHTKHAT